MKKEEELAVDQKKRIIEKIVKNLSKTNSDLYYADSSTISHIIKDYIADNNLNKNDYDLVKDLSPSDILVLMSFHSNCC